jgi:hypothetical protein
MSIEAAVRTCLVNNGNVAAIVETRVYLSRMPQNPTYPAIALRIVSMDQEMAHDGPVDFAGNRVQVDLYAEEFAEVRSLADAVRVALNGYHGLSADEQVWVILFENEMDEWGDLLTVWRITQDYRVMWRCGV